MFLVLYRIKKKYLKNPTVVSNTEFYGNCFSKFSKSLTIFAYEFQVITLILALPRHGILVEKNITHMLFLSSCRNKHNMMHRDRLLVFPISCFFFPSSAWRSRGSGFNTTAASTSLGFMFSNSLS